MPPKKSLAECGLATDKGITEVSQPDGIIDLQRFSSIIGIHAGVRDRGYRGLPQRIEERHRRGRRKSVLRRQDDHIPVSYTHFLSCSVIKRSFGWPRVQN